MTMFVVRYCFQFCSLLLIVFDELQRDVITTEARYNQCTSTMTGSVLFLLKNWIFWYSRWYFWFVRVRISGFRLHHTWRYRYTHRNIPPTSSPSRRNDVHHGIVIFLSFRAKFIGMTQVTRKEKNHYFSIRVYPNDICYVGWIGSRHRHSVKRQEFIDIPRLT